MGRTRGMSSVRPVLSVPVLQLSATRCSRCWTQRARRLSRFANDESREDTSCNLQKSPFPGCACAVGAALTLRWVMIPLR